VWSHTPTISLKLAHNFWVILLTNTQRQNLTSLAEVKVIRGELTWGCLGGDKAAASDNYRDFDSAIDCSAAEWLALRGACVAASWRHTHNYKLISRRCSEMIGAEMTSLCCCCCCCCSCGVASLLDGPNPSASVDEFSSCCCFYVRREINRYRMRR